MSINFHANQYEQAFTPHRTQNWEVPKNVKGKYPDTNTGFTRIKANEKGHLLPNVPKERSSPWGTHVGTWDMPVKIPGNRITNPTARSEQAVISGVAMKENGEEMINGTLKRCRTVDPLPVKMDALDDIRPAGILCEPCYHGDPIHSDTNQPRALSRKSGSGLQWPQAKSPGCISPVGNALSPKPVTPMAVADVDVQQFAEKCVSPLAPREKNAIIGALNTPDADQQRYADKPPSPQDRIIGMKSPHSVVQDNFNAHAEAALVS